MKIKVLILTTIFPNNIEPYKGTFNKQIINELGKFIDLKVIAPVPWFPDNKLLIKLLPNHAKYTKVIKNENLEGMEIYHPRYLVIPKILRSFYGFFYFLCVLPLIIKIKKSFNFDLIFASWAYPDGFAGVLYSILFKRPVIAKVHGCDINLLTRYFLLKLLISKALKKTEKVIAVSKALKARLMEINIPELRIDVITNGVDTELFKPLDIIECRKKLDLPLDKKIILFIGSLEEVKGIEYLINTYKEVSDKIKDSLLVLIGEGSLKDYLMKLIIKNNLDKKILMIGEKNHKEIPIWINSCDLFCLPSIREGNPNVLLEACACNKYIVASNVGGVPEIVVSEEIGILVPPANSELLGEALIYALSNSQLKKIQSVKFTRNWNRVAEEMYQIMEDVYNKKKLHVKI